MPTRGIFGSTSLPALLMRNWAQCTPRRIRAVVCPANAVQELSYWLTVTVSPPAEVEKEPGTCVNTGRS